MQQRLKAPQYDGKLFYEVYPYKLLEIINFE
jgi:hypothetical protein